MCDGGRDRDGIELVEYCDKRFLDACDMGRGSVLRRDGGEVINGGRGGCAALVVCEEITGGEVAGEEPGDMTAVMTEACGRGGEGRCSERMLRYRSQAYCGAV